MYQDISLIPPDVYMVSAIRALKKMNRSACDLTHKIFPWDLGKMWQCVKTLYRCSSHQNSWDLWMFIPLKMVLIGIDPYQCQKVTCKNVYVQAPEAPDIRYLCRVRKIS